jgi:hypothetical protein
MDRFRARSARASALHGKPLSRLGLFSRLSPEMAVLRFVTRRSHARRVSLHSDPTVRGGEGHESDATSSSHPGKRRDPRWRRRRNRERCELQRHRNDAQHNDTEYNDTKHDNIGGLVNDTVAGHLEPELPGHVIRRITCGAGVLMGAVANPGIRRSDPSTGGAVGTLELRGRARPASAVASSCMSHLARPTLRVIIGPLAVAAFAGFELRLDGKFAATAGAFCVFAICVFALGLWGKIQLERTRRRLHSLRNRRSGRTR